MNTRCYIADPIEKWNLFVDKTPGQGPNGDCWKWTGSLNLSGYGIFFWPKFRTVGAHVASYWISSGDRETKGFDICHSCDIPSCVNPAHLSKQLHRSNILEAYQKGRVPLGTFRPASKLTEGQVLEIRIRATQGETVSSLSRFYGISRPAIRKVVNRKSYNCIP